MKIIVLQNRGFESMLLLEYIASARFYMGTNEIAGICHLARATEFGCGRFHKSHIDSDQRVFAGFDKIREYDV